ncbi:ATP-binding cassette domain-containing protein [Maritimibacter sp. DP07]|uniref:ATP-binding cassette domain-containing protein n=1 Tax=Maritimibacter harenae TaxID=2606218 RepID=A0A845M1Z1_9RHOB|nr:sugar ABC transporter ATP-binding protein [Maritimibacter harenae]MZR11533.1 ATP-binding cassette domain-containing protein [Maritimibacter harenae]
MNADAILSVRGIGVRFGDVEVLSGVDLDIRPGEIHGLIGENGAGKSTLGKVLGGYYRATRGEIAVNGRTQDRWDTPTALANGVAIMHQELQLVPALTTAQNVFLGLEDHRRGVLRRTEADRLAALMEESGLHVEPNALAAHLTIAEQQKIEILRALAREARVIVMDEPTASLSKAEIDQLHRIMRQLRDEGRSVIYVTHFLDDVLDVTDRVTVLRNGELVQTRDTAGETKASLVSAMLGGVKSETLYPPKPRDVGEVVLSVRDLFSPNGTRVDQLEIRAGEIVGLAGLVGAGRTEIARAIIGADRAQGTVEIGGQPLQNRSISGATEAGVVMVPEDRRGQGLVMSLPVRANISLPHLGRVARGGVVAQKTERGIAKRLIEQLDVRPAILDGDVSNYSGGNQQKVLIGKWLAGDPRVLILDEPSRGVDVGARETIHNEIVRLAKSGVAILLISSEIEEVLGLATRAFLVDRGTLVDEIDPDRVNVGDVLTALFNHQGMKDGVT